MLTMGVEEVSKPCVEMAFDAIGREFGEQCGVPDCIESSRYVFRDGPDMMSDIEGLHSLLGSGRFLTQLCSGLDSSPD